MRRSTVTPRANWRPGLVRYPFGMAAVGAGALWREDVRYEFSVQQIDLIESVADELHGMIREALRRVMADRACAALGYRADTVRLIEASWADYWRQGGINERAGGLVGRLTLAYDGRDSLKLLGCNYDTPDGLFAAAIVQRNWREAMAGDADQFNSLHEALVERWEELAAGSGREAVHVACAAHDPMGAGEAAYLAATAAEAGIAARRVELEAIARDGMRFVDPEGEAIAWLYKLYPWEALADSVFTTGMRAGGMAVLDPIWRWPMSNHGLVALLWGLYPGHPNLCRASVNEADLAGCDAVTVRSFFGLDHPTERLTRHGAPVADSGPVVANPGGWLWMETPPVFEQDGVHAVLHAWIVGDKCLGMSVRESADPRVGPEAAMVPHLFRP
ncbi:glutathionylspermidine synthase family protein [Azospirillum halopraeferens]|uniref:glutathionylspermidine synthase family protein n=1 Tax=Azospirillum halopraeferens TaxID=34010 RepID=UPI0004900C7B|nr:glutathionylspermidine synthase family protein [Azospirillum halopraeferens]